MEDWLCYCMTKWGHFFFFSNNTVPCTVAFSLVKWNSTQSWNDERISSTLWLQCNFWGGFVVFLPSLAVSYFALISSLRLFLKTLIYSAHCCFNRLTPRGRDYYGVALSVNWSWACDYITITRIHRYISSLARRSAHSPTWILLLVCLKSASLAGLWRSVSPWERGRLQIKSLAPLNSDT